MVSSNFETKVTLEDLTLGSAIVKVVSNSTQYFQLSYENPKSELSEAEALRIINLRRVNDIIKLYGQVMITQFDDLSTAEKYVKAYLGFMKLFSPLICASGLTTVAKDKFGEYKAMYDQTKQEMQAAGSIELLNSIPAFASSNFSRMIDRAIDFDKQIELYIRSHQRRE